MSCGHFVDQTASIMVSCSNDGRVILWNVQQNCKRANKKKRFYYSFYFFIAIFAELDVDATPLTSVIAMNTQK